MVYTLYRMSEASIERASITRKPGAFEKRIHEIDFIRGFLIALVLMDHLFCFCGMYNDTWWHRAAANGLNYQFFKAVANVCDFYWNSTARQIVRFFALFGFTFVSGISTAFSKNNWIRAGQMLAIFGIIAVGSNVIDPYVSPIIDNPTRIDFNVIGVLAWSTLFYCFFQKGGWRTVAIGALIMLLISWIYYPLFFPDPEGGSSTMYAPPLVRPEGQADWMQFFPFAFFFFAGALFSEFVYLPKKQSLIKKRFNWERPLCFMGRHSLIIYGTHVFIIIGVLLLFDQFMGK